MIYQINHSIKWVDSITIDIIFYYTYKLKQSIMSNQNEFKSTLTESEKLMQENTDNVVTMAYKLRRSWAFRILFFRKWRKLGYSL